MSHQYILRIEGAEPEAVARAVGQSSQADGSWAYVLIEDAEDEPVAYISIFLSFLEKHSDELSRLGLCNEDATIWVLYEYAEQCNLYFQNSDIYKIGEAGVDLCISCWQKT